MKLITGATGFVGGAVLARAAIESPNDVRAAVRTAASRIGRGIETVSVGDLAADTEWSGALAGVDTVIHCAARVHVMRESAVDPLSEFRRVNVAGTLHLARQAAAVGTKRFVFVSSIKVNGEQTSPGRPYGADDRPAPVDPYGISKSEAEQGLRQLAQDTGLEVVIVRPVLVYGPGVRANFRAMMQWLHRGIPLPFGAIDNRRSLIALDNLVDLLMLCSDHPAAANQTFLASDCEDLSTPELLRRTAEALGTTARLISVPARPILALASAVGIGDLTHRLWGSLQVDTAKTRKLLGWTPVLSVDDGLKRTAQAFLRELNSRRR